MKKFIVVVTGEDRDGLSMVFIEAKNEESALLAYLESIQDFTFDDEFDKTMMNQLLKEYPIMIACVDTFRNMTDVDYVVFNELPI